VGQQPEPRWRWQARAHGPGAGLAEVCGRRTDEGLLPWKALLEPLGITRYATEPWGTDARHLDPEAPHAGQHHTQHSERTQLPLRTRITR
jgi:insertion element IS1 protein InsB